MRHNLIMCVVGRQGVGKSYQTRKELLLSYVQGKKVLIFEPNDDAKMKYYTSKEIIEAATLLKKAGKKPKIKIAKYKKSPLTKRWPIKRLPYNALIEEPNQRAWGIRKFGEAKAYGIRRISPLLNAQSHEKKGASVEEMSTEQLKQVATDILKFFRPIDAGARNGVVLLDDINKYLLSMHNQQDFVGAFMNIRHRGSDYYLHYHDVMQIPPPLYRFGGLIRLHKAVAKIRKAQKIPYEYLKVGECVVEEMRKKNPYAFAYIYASEGKIMGVNKQDYINGCKEFLRLHPAIVKAYGSEQKAIDKYLIEWWAKE